LFSGLVHERSRKLRLDHRKFRLTDNNLQRAL
jgi:hypothetical protein